MKKWLMEKARAAVRAIVMWAMPELAEELMKLRVRQLALQVNMTEALQKRDQEIDGLRAYAFVINRLALQQQTRLDVLEESPTMEGLGLRVARLELHVLPATGDERAWERSRDSAHIDAIVMGGRGGVRS